MKTKLALAAILAGALSGCTLTRYKEGDASFIRIAIGTNQAIGPVRVQAGDRSLSMGSYAVDQAEGLGTAVNAATAIAR